MIWNSFAFANFVPKSLNRCLGFIFLCASLSVIFEQKRLPIIWKAFQANLISFIIQRTHSFLKQLNLKPQASFYEACSNVDIIKRVLRNLISSYEKPGYLDKVEELKELASVLEN